MAGFSVVRRGQAVGRGEQLSEAVVKANLSPFTQIEAHGHSWVLGGGATNNHGYVQKLAAILNLPLTNRGVGGAVAQSDQQTSGSGAGNGWVKVLQDLPRSAGTAPYLPASSLYIVHYGGVDAFYFNATPAAILQFKSAMRTIISRIRAAGTGVFGAAHASIAYAGAGWSTVNATNVNSGTSYGVLSTSGGTATITVPADFPGGTIALGWISSTGWAASYAVTVDAVAAPGSPVATIAMPANAYGKATSALGQVLRINNLAPGAHTIVVTLNSITTDATFNYWQIEAPEPPLILIPNEPRLTSGGYNSFVGLGAPFAPGDAGLQAYSVAIAQVAAEFDQYVKVVPLDALVGNSTYLIADSGLHPTDAGHSVIANACLRVLQGAWLPALATTS